MICYGCDYYDSSTDACNADDKCYTEGYQKGKADADTFLKSWKDDVVNSLAKYDANSVEEVYRYGIARGRIIERENIFEWLKTKDIRLKDVYMYEMKEQKNE